MFDEKEKNINIHSGFSSVYIKKKGERNGKKKKDVCQEVKCVGSVISYICYYRYVYYSNDRSNVYVYDDIYS